MKIPKRIAQTLMNSLKGGVVPRVGLSYVTVGRKAEIDALLPLVGSRHVHLEGTAAALDGGCAIDLGGIAKGYASDKTAELFAGSGISGGFVSLGGNVYVHGTTAEGKPWNVAIQNPRRTDGFACTLHLSDAFVVTSGGYQRYFEEDGVRYSHILDPKTGYPAESGLVSVTIVSSDGTLADGLSTSLFIMGEEKAADFWREHKDEFDAILMSDDGTLYVTEGLENDFSTERTVEIIR